VKKDDHAGTVTSNGSWRLSVRASTPFNLFSPRSKIR